MTFTKHHSGINIKFNTVLPLFNRLSVKTDFTFSQQYSKSLASDEKNQKVVFRKFGMPLFRTVASLSVQPTTPTFTKFEPNMYLRSSKSMYEEFKRV